LQIGGLRDTQTPLEVTSEQKYKSENGLREEKNRRNRAGGSEMILIAVALVR
jgi:hypothetical protein